MIRYRILADEEVSNSLFTFSSEKEADNFTRKEIEPYLISRIKNILPEDVRFKNEYFRGYTTWNTLELEFFSRGKYEEHVYPFMDISIVGEENPDGSITFNSIRFWGMNEFFEKKYVSPSSDVILSKPLRWGNETTVDVLLDPNSTSVKKSLDRVIEVFEEQMLYVYEDVKDYYHKRLDELNRNSDRNGSKDFLLSLMKNNGIDVTQHNYELVTHYVRGKSDTPRVKKFTAFGDWNAVWSMPLRKSPTGSNILSFVSEEELEEVAQKYPTPQKLIDSHLQWVTPTQNIWVERLTNLDTGKDIYFNDETPSQFRR